MEPDPQGEHVVYKLKHPIQHGGVPILELRIKELTAGVMEDMPLDQDKATIGHILRLVARASDQPFPAIKKLKYADVLGVVEAVVPFWGLGETAGTTR